MLVTLAGVGKAFGARVILEHVDLTLDRASRVGVVGPNGVGKSTLLQIVAGRGRPDAGSVARRPATATIGYLAQDPDLRPAETLIAYLARRTGVRQAEDELRGQADALAVGTGAGDDYARGLERFLALGGGDLPHRAAAVCAELDLGVDLEHPAAGLSGGQAARAALAAILLSRFDLLLLDEPTNNLDFSGLELLERFLAGFSGGLALVSHDRALLDRVVTRILEVDPWSHAVREWAGGWSDYERARQLARRGQYEAYKRAEERKREIAALLRERRGQARAGASLGKQTGGADRRPTRALRGKVRQAERALERVERVEKPYEPWELRLTLEARRGLGDRVLGLEGAVAERGAFRLGPIDLDLAPGDRLAVTGPNGVGKSTLLAMLLGDLPLVSGRRWVGRGTEVGALGQDRDAYRGPRELLETFSDRAGSSRAEARTLLAKFGLGAEHVVRACSSLSPGESTRAHLAEFMARGVNCLLLDEPTNHLDLEAIEELEEALGPFDGTLVLVSHDRRFLERVTSSRRLDLRPT